jgi:sporulation protein YlmC with PRC-barrel domain
MGDKWAELGMVLHDRTVLDRRGEKIGKVADVFLSDDTDESQWLLVRVGLFGMREAFVPLASVRLRGRDLFVAYDKDSVTGAPNVSSDDELSSGDQQTLTDYYAQQRSTVVFGLAIQDDTPEVRRGAQ